MALTKILTEGIKDGEIKDADINTSANIATSKISGLAASATTDTTNASNISSGTLPDARYSIELSRDTTPQLGGTLDTNGNIISFPDSAGVNSNRLKIGSGNDIEMFHVSNNNYIDFPTGYDTYFRTGTNRENAILIKPDNAVELYWNGTKKFETLNTGVRIPDDMSYQVGTGADLQIFHNQADNFIRTLNGTIYIDGIGGEQMITAIPDNEVKLYYDGNLKFFTKSNGAQFNGVLRCDDGNGASGSYATFGDDGDLQIYHDGTNSRIRNNISGKPLLIQNSGGDTRIETLGNFLVDSWEGESIAKFNRNGNVQLYNDNVLKFETKDYGINVQGTNSVNTQIKIHNNDVIGRSYWGYSTGYNGVTVGRTDTGTASTIFMGVDVTANSSGSFAGNGTEIVFRNNHIFKTPNAANNNYVTPFRFGRATSTEGAVNFPQGLMFGSDQADANILDDYEEGIHVLAVSGTTDFSISASYDEAPYTKIGRLVTLRGLIYISAVSGSGGYVRVTLPYTAANDQAGVRYSGNIGTVMHNGVNTGDCGLVGYISGNSNRMGFYKVSDNSSWSHLVASDLTVGDEMYFTISYEV